MVPAVTPSSLLVGGIVLGVVVLLGYWARWTTMELSPSDGEHTLAWLLGCLALVTMGGAPLLVGIGLYLTVERDAPLDALVIVVLLSVATFGLMTVLIT
jgi:cytochrome c oxidase assembly factor CtaG